MEEYYTRQLTINDFDAMYDLHMKVKDDLKKERHEYFLYNRTRAEFQKLIENNYTVGAFNSKDKLIGKSSLSKPYTSYDLDLIKQLGIKENNDLYLIKSTAIDPSYQGLGISKLMTRKLIDHAKNNIIVSIMSINNFKSLCCRLKDGFHLKHYYKRPIDQREIFYLIKNPKTLLSSSEDLIKIKHKQTSKIKNILENAYIGISADKKTKDIYFSINKQE